MNIYSLVFSDTWLTSQHKQEDREIRCVDDFEGIRGSVVALRIRCTIVQCVVGGGFLGPGRPECGVPVKPRITTERFRGYIRWQLTRLI